MIDIFRYFIGTVLLIAGFVFGFWVGGVQMIWFCGIEVIVMLINDAWTVGGLALNFALVGLGFPTMIYSSYGGFYAGMILYGKDPKEINL